MFPRFDRYKSLGSRHHDGSLKAKTKKHFRVFSPLKDRYPAGNEMIRQHCEIYRVSWGVHIFRKLRFLKVER